MISSPRLILDTNCRNLELRILGSLLAAAGEGTGRGGPGGQLGVSTGGKGGAVVSSSAVLPQTAAAPCRGTPDPPSCPAPTRQRVSQLARLLQRIPRRLLPHRAARCRGGSKLVHPAAALCHALDSLRLRKLVRPARRLGLLLLLLVLCRPGCTAAGTRLPQAQPLKLLRPLLLLLLLSSRRHGGGGSVLSGRRRLCQPGRCCRIDAVPVGSKAGGLCWQRIWADVQGGQQPAHLLVCKEGGRARGQHSVSLLACSQCRQV